MYNLYQDEKNKENLEKTIKEEKNNLIIIKKYKTIQKNLVENYQKRIKQFIVDVSYFI